MPNHKRKKHQIQMKMEYKTTFNQTNFQGASPSYRRGSRAPFKCARAGAAAANGACVGLPSVILRGAAADLPPPSAHNHSARLARPTHMPTIPTAYAYQNNDAPHCHREEQSDVAVS